MFTAMIFDHLKDTYGLNVDYEILEAEKSIKDGGKGVGGRLYTHTFKETDSKYPIGSHDYYDVGAMRFPDSDVMARYDYNQFGRVLQLMRNQNISAFQDTQNADH
jgi:hypothetical protein